VVPSDRPRVRPTPPPESPEVRAPRIIVADDDRIARESTAGCLRAGGYLVDAVESGQEVLDRVAQGSADLVLLDVMMPRMSGLETCRLLKAMGAEAFVPVILVTGKTDIASRVEGLKIGADDYICKPVEDLELLARVSAMLRIKRMYDDVATQRTKLRKLTAHDELTGLYNQRFVLTRLTEEFKRSERYHEPFACMMVDIDPIRSLSAGGGWVADDALIKGVADRIQKSVREVDVLARYGGDSFLLLLPSTHFAGSLAVAERVWREICEQTLEVEGIARKVTVSIGIALYPSMDIRTKEALVKAMEEALAQAKRAGGNRICAFQQQGYIYTPPVGGGVGGASAGPPSSRRGMELAAAAGVTGPQRERISQPNLQKAAIGVDAAQDSSRRKPQ
jgi:two-component system cell cycle response regulator